VGRRLLVLLALGGCATLRSVDVDAVPVERLRLSFAGPGQGLLEFAVRLPPPVARVERLEWELWLDGLRFAAGVEGQVELTGGVAQLSVPLAWRSQGFREGRGWLDVALRGSVEAPGRRFTFRDRRELELTGRPVLFVPLE
jgi:hypothetical protein